MRILIGSHVFSPSIGGIESISAMLAEAFVRQGHDVRLITQTPAEDNGACHYEVIRQPDSRALKAQLGWCEVFWQNNISLKTLGPALLKGTPTVITHQTWLMRTDGRIGWQDVVKKLASTRVTNVAISRAIADNLPGSPIVIGNPYRETLFRRDDAIAKDRDVVFLGRLVSDKGADVLVEALHGMDATCTIIGNGPERDALEQLAKARGCEIDFTGAMSGEALVNMLNRHRIIAVPSRWQEPFGIVALEGLACGCVPAVSSGGGLPDAIGPCGVTFPNENVAELRQSLQSLIGNAPRRNELCALAPAHLAKHTTDAIAARYVEVFKGAAE